MNLGMLGEQAHGEKSLFVWQRWNHNLQSPFCPVNPTAIKGRERGATGKSDQSPTHSAEQTVHIFALKEHTNPS